MTTAPLGLGARRFSGVDRLSHTRLKVAFPSGAKKRLCLAQGTAFQAVFDEYSGNRDRAPQCGCVKPKAHAQPHVALQSPARFPMTWSAIPGTRQDDGPGLRVPEQRFFPARPFSVCRSWSTRSKRRPRRDPADPDTRDPHPSTRGARRSGRSHG